MAAEKGEKSFLEEKYPDLQKPLELDENRPGMMKDTPVERAVKSQERTTGEKIRNNPEERIGVYLNRLERLALDSEKEQPRKMFGSENRPRALLLLREMVMNKYVRTNKDKLAQGATAVEERAARQIGIDAHYGQQELEQRGEIAVVDLEKSLDNWISYLSDMNEPYPTWFRYYAFRNVLDMGDYDKDKGEFTKRSKGSTRLFPDIDRGALAYTEQMIEASKDSEMLKRLQKAQALAANGSIPEEQLITKEKVKNFSKLSFTKQYAEGIKQAGEITPEMREEIHGEWVKYQQGTDPTALWASLQNKGTSWCTKGFATAETQLKGGDFYVYYTLDKQGKPAIPRLAIRMDGHDKISNDVRGVFDSQQNVEGNMTPILDTKLKEFGPEADRFRKKSADMKQLTEIENKADQQLTPAELKFLYEMDGQIEGFGYEKDPRIKELRDKRDVEQDMLVIFECQTNQIAHNPKEITKDTKVYVGELKAGIFELVELYNIEHIYTQFPEGRIRRENVEIGGKNTEDLKQDLEKNGIKISDYANDMLASKDFTTSENLENIPLIRLKVSDLGFKEGATTDEIYKRANELGLELCPAEVGPNLRLKYKDQPMGEYLRIAMKQISARDGDPHVFSLGHGVDGLCLHNRYAPPAYWWLAAHVFVFRPRKF